MNFKLAVGWSEYGSSFPERPMVSRTQQRKGTENDCRFATDVSDHWRWQRYVHGSGHNIHREDRVLLRSRLYRAGGSFFVPDRRRSVLPDRQFANSSGWKENTRRQARRGLPARRIALPPFMRGRLVGRPGPRRVLERPPIRAGGGRSTTTPMLQ